MLNKIKKLIGLYNLGVDLSKHRCATLKYEDLCQ